MRNRLRRATTALLVLVLVLTAAPAAWAQDSAPAEQLFLEGQKLMEAGKVEAPPDEPASTTTVAAPQDEGLSDMQVTGVVLLGVGGAAVVVEGATVHFTMGS